jgi:hypothetical protein
MKIRLLKDLPGAKAGEVFEVINVSIKGETCSGISTHGVDYNMNTIFGWYEEVIKETGWWFYPSNGEVKEVDDLKNWVASEKKFQPLFRTKESAEKYRDSLKDTYGKKIKSVYSEDQNGFIPEITISGEHAKNVVKIVDALNDRVH